MYSIFTSKYQIVLFNFDHTFLNFEEQITNFFNCDLYRFFFFESIKFRLSAFHEKTRTLLRLKSILSRQLDTVRGTQVHIVGGRNNGKEKDNRGNL